MIDLLQLHKDEILTTSTLQWIQPLYEQELAEAAEIKEEMLVHGAGGFIHQDDDDDEEEEEDLQTLSTASIHNLDGISFSFAVDDQSSGHGNRVWHASIAMCIYLKRLLALQANESSSSSFRSLELGAGTALPSLFLAHAVLQQKHSTADDDPLSSSSSSSNNNKSKPFIHIMDAKQYRNLRQILVSISRQPQMVRDCVQFRVSPHNWGEVLVEQEKCSLEGPPTTKSSSPATAPNNNSNNNSYDLVIVSDCLYNPTHHDALLQSIAATLCIPSGRAVISFSLHGNTPDDDIWTFVEETINNKQTTKSRALRQQEEDCSTTTPSISSWRLQARPIPQQHLLQVPSTTALSRGGWNMEDTMKELELWVANMEPKRWFAYMYEVTWVPVVEDEDDDDVDLDSSDSSVIL